MTVELRNFEIKFYPMSRENLFKFSRYFRFDPNSSMDYIFENLRLA